MPAEPKARGWGVPLLREVYGNVRESLGTQFFYAAGLAIQKGLPFLLIPVLTRLYGEQTYASYVLFYASVQVFANLFSLAVPNSIITFWYAEENKQSLTWTYVIFLLSSQVILSALLAGVIFHVYSQSFSKPNAWPLTLLALFFTLLYNFNAFLTGVCRARNYSRGYFRAQFVAAAALVLGVVLLQGSARVELLVGLFMMSVTLQNLYLLVAMRDLLGRPAVFFDTRLIRRVLAYSLPLIVHIEATLFLYWVDKYLVRLYFPPGEFSRFTISVQYAFAQAFFSQVFMLHTFPLICRLTAEGEREKLRSVIRSYNLLLAVLGGSWIGFILLLSWGGVPLGIHPTGFLLVGLGTLLWIVASNYISALWARFQTARVTAVSLGAAVVLVAILAVGCWTRAILVCYFAHLGCAAAGLGALIYLSKGFGKPGPWGQFSPPAQSSQGAP